MAARSESPSLAGGEDLAVLGIEPLGREVDLRVDVQVGAGRVAERLDHVHEARATGELVQLRVEPQVELEVPLDAGPGRHLVEHGGKLLAARRVEPLGRALGGERLERRADLVVLAEALDGGDEHDGAALRVQADEPLGLQRRERLAHGRRAHAEAPCELHLAQPRAGLQLTRDDVFAKARCDRCRDRAVHAQGTKHPLLHALMLHIRHCRV